MNAIDTNVLFYSLDADEVVKQPKAVALIGQLTVASDYGRHE
jgi:predicted nucleic acid-binding protein